MPLQKDLTFERFARVSNLQLGNNYNTPSLFSLRWR